MTSPVHVSLSGLFVHKNSMTDRQNQPRRSRHEDILSAESLTQIESFIFLDMMRK